MARSGVENAVFAVDWADTEPYAAWSDVPASELSQFTDVDGLPLRLDRLDQIFTLAAARGLTVLLPRVLDAPDMGRAAQQRRPRAHARACRPVRGVPHRADPPLRPSWQPVGEP